MVWFPFYFILILQRELKLGYLSQRSPDPRKPPNAGSQAASTIALLLRPTFMKLFQPGFA